MQQGSPTPIVSNSKELRIKQLKIQIKMLEDQLEAAKRDLRNLEKSK